MTILDIEKRDSPHGGLRPWHLFLAVLILTLTSLVLKLHGAFDHPLWGDELTQRRMTLSATWTQLLSWTHDHPYYDWPPGFFILSRLIQEITGADTVSGWRWPGILAGVMCTPVAYLVARRVGLSRLAALAAAALATCDLNLNYNSQIARGYPFQVLFILAGLWCGVGRSGLRWWLPAFACFLGALWCHLVSFVFLAGVLLPYVLVRSVRRDAAAPAISEEAIGIGLTVALTSSAALWAAQYGLRATLAPEYALSVSGWAQTIGVMRWVIGRLTWVPIPYANPLLFVAAAGGLLGFTLQRRCRLSAGLLLGSFLVAAIQAYVLRTHPFTEPRYLITVSMTLWFGWPMLADAIGGRAGRTLAASILLLQVPQAWRAWNNDSYYGSIAGERALARAFPAAVERAAALARGTPIRLEPYRCNFPEAVQHAGVAAVSAAEALDDPAALTVWQVWLVANYGDQWTGVFVADATRRWFTTPQERDSFMHRFRLARWAVITTGPAGVETQFY